MAKASKHLTTIKSAPDRAGGILRAYRKAVAEVKAKRLLTPEQKTEQITQLTRKATDQLKDLRGDVGLAEKAIKSGGVQPQGDTPERQLSETRRTKAWDRIRPMLDSSKDVTGGALGSDVFTIVREAVTAAVKNGDADAYQALTDELPAYLDAKKLDYFKPAVAKLLKPGETLTRAPEALNEEAVIGSKLRRVETAIKMTEHAISAEDEGDYTIPDYDDGQTITIEAVGEAQPFRDEDGYIIESSALPELKVG